MMSSNFDYSPEEVIKEVMLLLDEDRISHNIDHKIDIAKKSFCTDSLESLTHLDFIKVITKLIQHIFQEGLQLPRHLSFDQAAAEAIYLLNQYYQNQSAKGYEAALINVHDNDGGALSNIIDSLTDIVKFIERKKYIQWVFNEHIEHLDWELRCRLVEAYQVQNIKILPPHLQNIDPARLVNVFCDLLINDSKDNNLVRQLFKYGNET